MEGWSRSGGLDHHVPIRSSSTAGQVRSLLDKRVGAAVTVALANAGVRAAKSDRSRRGLPSTDAKASTSSSSVRPRTTSRMREPNGRSGQRSCGVLYSMALSALFTRPV